MNEEAMRKHYERTPKETLISILISSREQVDKLQNRNEELKQENERLNQILNKAKEKSIDLQKRYGYITDDLTYLLMQGSDKK